MIDRSLEWLALLTRYWSAAMAALDGIGITVALMLLAAILAGAGGMVNPKDAPLRRARGAGCS